MTEYGYINDAGYLVSRNIEEQQERYRDTDGKIKSRTLTVEEQIEKLSANGWKPVERLDESRLQCEDGYVVRIMPYDAGDRIAYHYEPVFDTQKVRREIEALKAELSNSDYKVIKCYEAAIIGEKMPYDAAVIHAERQSIRDKINELEKL
nr:hypothetical protein [uncultured Alistipes sp.]